MSTPKESIRDTLEEARSLVHELTAAQKGLRVPLSNSSELPLEERIQVMRLHMGLGMAEKSLLMAIDEMDGPDLPPPQN